MGEAAQAARETTGGKKTRVSRRLRVLSEDSDEEALDSKSSPNESAPPAKRMKSESESRLSQVKLGIEGLERELNEEKKTRTTMDLKIGELEKELARVKKENEELKKNQAGQKWDLEKKNQTSVVVQQTIKSLEEHRDKISANLGKLSKCLNENFDIGENADIPGAVSDVKLKAASNQLAESLMRTSNANGNRAGVEELQLQFCQKVLEEIAGDNHWRINEHFQTPVDPVALNVPTYFHIIQKPMDLGTVRQKLKQKEYRSAKDFEDDVRLIFRNCYKFNGHGGNGISKKCHKLEEMFDKKWAELAGWVDAHEWHFDTQCYTPCKAARDCDNKLI